VGVSRTGCRPNGPLREEIEKQGGLKLIYIEPPFDVGWSFGLGILKLMEWLNGEWWNWRE